jgi:non-heme chloroperoxidase
MPTITTDDDVKLSYTTVGTGPRAVLFVHGWMASSAVYAPTLEHLDATGLRLVIPDLRGAGASGSPAEGYGIERYVRDLLAVADAEKLTTFTVIGHSMGGLIAQVLAATAPERVTGLVLICPVPASGIALPDDARGLFRGSARNREMQATILKLACKEITDEARDRLLDVAGVIEPRCIEQAFDAWSKGGFEDRLASVRARTLVVATDDPFTPPPFLRDTIVSKVKGARLAHLPGPGHYPVVERPRETAALIEAFLAGLPS